MSTEVGGRLAFSVTGPGGATSGTVTGDGAVVRVHAEDPVAAWDAALGSVSTGPAVLSFVAQLLHDEGLALEITGPAGRVATVGAGVQSPLGRVLAGSRHVRLGTPAAVRPLAVAEARRRLRAAPVPAAALLLVGALAVRAGVRVAVRAAVRGAGRH